jgi:hypothetical protein
VGKLFTAGARIARTRGVAALLGTAIATAHAAAASPDPDQSPPAAAIVPEAAPSLALPMLFWARPATLELLWFDAEHAVSPAATEGMAAEVRRIFRGLGVDVSFRVAAPDANYGGGPRPQIAIILLKDDPVVTRRPRRVMGVIGREALPTRAVWAFLENVRWTLGRDQAREPGLGRALGRVVAHEVIHAVAPDEPHTRGGLMNHSMNRAFLLGENAGLDARCGQAFVHGLAARAARERDEDAVAARAAFR